MAFDCRTVRQRPLTSSGWTARGGNSRPSPLPAVPKHRFPVASSLAQPQIDLIVEVRAVPAGSSAAVRRYSRTAWRCAGALSQIVERPGVPAATAPGRQPGVAVPLQVHPLHLTGLQAHCRVVAGLFAIARAASPPSRLHPFASQFGIEMGLVGEEYLRSRTPRTGWRTPTRLSRLICLDHSWDASDKTQAVHRAVPGQCRSASRQTAAPLSSSSWPVSMPDGNSCTAPVFVSPSACSRRQALPRRRRRPICGCELPIQCLRCSGHRSHRACHRSLSRGVGATSQVQLAPSPGLSPSYPSPSPLSLLS